MPRHLSLLALALLAASIPPSRAAAGCCDIRKLDDETPSVTLRACAATSGSACAQTIYEGLVQLGEARHVCVSGPTLAYQLDSGAGFSPPVVAVCDGDDIEI